VNSATIWTLVAVIVGGGISIGGQVILESVKDGRKAEQLSHAIAGEILALLQIVEDRKYIQGIQAQLAMARAGTASLFKARVEQTYFSVIEANLQHIGSLPVELPLLIPKFLTLSKSALEDFQAIRAGEWDHMTAAELVPMYDGLIQVMQAAMSTGREIVTLIATIYASPHNRYPMRTRAAMLGRKLFGKGWWVWAALFLVIAGAVVDMVTYLRKGL
jgi:hypothetical protein